MKRLVTLILAVLVIFSVSPITAWAENPNIVTSQYYLKDFQSLDELKVFLADDNTDQTVFLNEAIPRNQMCCSYVQQLRDRAMDKGYYLSYQLTQNNQHAINMAWIGKDIYFIEPQSDAVWRVTQRGDRQ